MTLTGRSEGKDVLALGNSVCELGANSLLLGFRVHRECQEVGQELLKAVKVMLEPAPYPEGVGDKRFKKVGMVRLV